MDEDLDFRFDCGYSKPSSQLTLEDRQKLVHAVWLHYVFFSVHAELAQFRKGLYETLRFEELVSSHPKVIHSFLVSSPSYDISASFLIDSFAVCYSAEGSNNRTREEAIMLWWSDYVLDSAGECRLLSLYYVHHKYHFLLQKEEIYLYQRFYTSSVDQPNCLHVDLMSHLKLSSQMILSFPMYQHVI